MDIYIDVEILAYLARIHNQPVSAWIRRCLYVYVVCVFQQF